MLGQSPLDDLLAQRDIINQKLQEIIDKQTEPWGIKVTAVEVKEVALPDSMKRAMAKQAEAERERRAKVVNAEGEFQAAEKMVQAAAMIAKEPIALQLRYLQTMREMASEHNTTTFLPLPVGLFSGVLEEIRTKPTRWPDGTGAGRYRAGTPVRFQSRAHAVHATNQSARNNRNSTGAIPKSCVFQTKVARPESLWKKITGESREAFRPAGFVEVLGSLRLSDFSSFCCSNSSDPQMLLRLCPGYPC